MSIFESREKIQWKEGHIEEMRNKLSIREIKIAKDDRKVEFKTENKCIMEHVV